MRNRHFSIILLICGVLSCSGANPFSFIKSRLMKGNHKPDPEGQFAGMVRRALFNSTVQRQSQPTNWNQIATNLNNPEIWIRYEQLFLQYPEEIRGFKKSVYEKYAFVEPGVIVPKRNGVSGGELVLLQVGAPPKFPVRFAIWREPSGYYGISTFRPSEIQEWFAKAGKQLPRPDTNLPPATPPGYHPVVRPSRQRTLSYILLVLFAATFGLVCFRLFQYFARHRPIK
jgi:hypothetical protein